MLILPTGQIFFTDFTKDVEIYTPNDQRVDNTWRPVIKDINSHAVANCYSMITIYPPPPCLTINRNSPNTLDGFQLNGLSQGAGYGDDYQDATNYPLVTVTEELPPCFQPITEQAQAARCRAFTIAGLTAIAPWAWQPAICWFRRTSTAPTCHQVSLVT